MVWKPAKTLGLIVGLIIVLTIVSIDVFLVVSMQRQPINLSLYVTGLLFVLSLPLLGVSAYWVYGLLTLRYYLDRNRLVITCGASRHVIPMGSVQRVISGAQVGVTEGIRGVGWPGYMAGRMSLEEGGSLYVYSTEPIQRQLVLVTADSWYGISPENTERFLAQLAEFRAQEPTAEVQQRIEHAAITQWPVWRDEWFWGAILVGLLANLVLFGVTFALYPGLPERIGLHFDARGDIDLVASKAGLLVIPVIGALALVVNSLLGILLHYKEQVAAYLLSGMSMILQAVLWVAALGILTR